MSEILRFMRVNPSVHLGLMDKIETIQRRSTVSMMTQMDKIDTIQRRSTVSMMTQMKHVDVVSASSLSQSLSNPRTPSYRVEKNDNKQKDKVILSRNLDDWMNEFIVDIIKNLKQAPLLVHVYANEDNDDERGSERPQPRSRPYIKTERALFENWPKMKNEWESGKTRIPDGLIFVEELQDDENQNLSREDPNEVLTKCWGVIVQGIDQFGPACYLLKTSRVKAGRGMDLFCTHFCLVRVKNFRESALKQFKSCWL